MIRLTRSKPEPTALADKRALELPKARTAALAGWKTPDGERFKFRGYDAGKEQLFADQHAKCAYCEMRQEQARFLDVDHYRPKGTYWWLAWSWDNLLFSCLHCNRTNKRDQFPLADEADRLAVEATPPGSERPLLLDPYDRTIDPSQHIVYRPERVQGNVRWVPHGTTREGRETIRVCALDRGSLLDRYTGHVRDVVRPRVAMFNVACTSEDAQMIVTAWSTLRRSLLAPGQEFSALSRDAARALVSVKIRERYGLDL